MTGSEGVLAPMMKHFLESMMAGELDHHLAESKRLDQPNCKNGKSKKTIRSLSSGEFELETNRDRLSTFEPKIVPKLQLIITEKLEGNILSMYDALGVSMRDYIQEMYAMRQKYAGSPIVYSQRCRNDVIARWMQCTPLYF